MATQTTELAFPPLDSQGTEDLISANVAAGDRSGDINTDLKKALIALLGLSGSNYALDDLWKRYQLSTVVTEDPDTISAGKPPSRTPPEHVGQHPKNFLPPGRIRNAGGTGGFRGGSNVPLIDTNTHFEILFDDASTAGAKDYTDQSSYAYGIDLYGAGSGANASAPLMPGATYHMEPSGTCWIDGGEMDQFTPGTGDWTVEWWQNAAGWSVVSGQLNWTSNSAVTPYPFQSQRRRSSENYEQYVYVNGSLLINERILENHPLLVWNHMAVVKQSGNVQLFVNGEPLGTPAADAGDYTATDYVMTIGNGNHTHNVTCYDDLDGIRLSDVARYDHDTSFRSRLTYPYPGSSTAPADGYYSDTIIVATLDGADAQTSFSDQSSLACGAATFNGSAALSTTQAKYGTTSLACLSDGDYIEFPYKAGLGVAAGEKICCEAWCYFTDDMVTGVNGIMGQWDVGTNQRSWALYTSNGKGYFSISTNGTTTITTSAPTVSMTTNTWYHLAASYDGARVNIWQDGLLIGSNAATSIYENTAKGVEVGHYDYAGAAANNMAGYICDARAWKENVRFAGKWSPPTAQIATS